MSHYPRGVFAPVNVIREWKLNFNLGCIVKYASRYFPKLNKGNESAYNDLLKIADYARIELNQEGFHLIGVDKYDKEHIIKELRYKEFHSIAD